AQVGVRIAGQGPAAPGPPLVEQHDPVGVRIEETSLTRGAARPGPAVEVERGFAIGIAAALPIQAMPVTYVAHAAVVGLNGWELARHPSPLSPPVPGRRYRRNRAGTRPGR